MDSTCKKLAIKLHRIAGQWTPVPKKKKDKQTNAIAKTIKAKKINAMKAKKYTQDEDFKPFIRNQNENAQVYTYRRRRQSYFTRGRKIISEKRAMNYIKKKN